MSEPAPQQAEALRVVRRCVLCEGPEHTKDDTPPSDHANPPPCKRRSEKAEDKSGLPVACCSPGAEPPGESSLGDGRQGQAREGILPAVFLSTLERVDEEPLFVYLGILKVRGSKPCAW